MLCKDTWTRQIPDNKLAAYRALIAEKQITKPHVTYDRQSGTTIVEYLAIAPHEWILEEMKRRLDG